MSGVKCLNKYDGKFLIYLPINFKLVQTLYIHLKKKVPNFLGRTTFEGKNNPMKLKILISSYSEVMNYRKPPSGNAFFKDDEPGITCNCWQECTRTEYAVEVAPNMLR